jgi:hypothetical protein
VHCTIGGDALAGPDHDQLSRPELLDGHATHVVAVRIGERRFLRPDVHEPLDRLTRTAHGERLQHVGQAEQEDQDRALERAADQRGADGGSAHQEVDGQLPLVPQRAPAIARDAGATYDVCQAQRQPAPR